VAVPMAKQNRFLLRWKLCHLLKLEIRNFSFAKLVLIPISFCDGSHVSVTNIENIVNRLDLSHDNHKKILPT
jgi:hypothetical protein